MGSVGDHTSLLVVVGGFLGAGKTTMIARTAERIRESGARVVVVTNDQGSGLVDTVAVTAVAHSVVEIAGGCFCCRYDRFQQAIEEVIRTQQPDLILAEAVGSCTDLAATVFRPLRAFAPGLVRLGPLTVVIDGPQLNARKKFGALPHLSDTVTYLYDRQLDEADVLLLNKIDLMHPGDCADLVSYLEVTYPSATVLAMSAEYGDGLPAWIDLFENARYSGQRVLNIDYDRYADAEVCLGWLNLEGQTVTHPHCAAAWLRFLLDGIQRRARADRVEIAHLKVWLGTQSGTVTGHVVTIDREPSITVSGIPSGRAQVIINARAATSPETLERWVADMIRDADGLTNQSLTVTHREAFRPSRPIPLFRLNPA